jgi:hypothetical protein
VEFRPEAGHGNEVVRHFAVGGSGVFWADEFVGGAELFVVVAGGGEVGRVLKLIFTAKTPRAQRRDF